ncbi:MAG: hypothetical protein PHU23_00220 [Dehalococcoidales bacterium]|nr:hypothetical protein [Dehalococcoidales bacterium]
MNMIGYLALRRLIGIVGLVFPFAMLICQKIQNPLLPLPGSISAYYYATDLTRSILVGALCAIGVFLSTYRGYDQDYIPVRLAAIFAVGVAFFPTVPIHPSGFNNLIGYFHGVFAALMFLTLAYISLFLFTKSSGIWLSRRKRARNLVYRTCGIIMVVAMVLIYPLTHWCKPIEFLHPMFWLETIIVVSFGVSWLVKGETLLRD